MKKLYESILKNTNIGKEAEKKELIQWLKSCSCRYFVSGKIDVESTRKGYIVNVSMDKNMMGSNYITFNKKDFESPLYKNFHIIKYVNVAGQKNFDVSYYQVKVFDTMIPDEVDEQIAFDWCTVNISRIPNNCKILYICGLSSKSKTIFIKPLKNIELERVIIDNHYGSNSALSGVITSVFDNVTITKYIDLDESSLGYYTLEKDSVTFTQSASDILTEFIKNNHVSEESILFHYPKEFMRTKCRYGEITFDKEKNRWKIKNFYN